MADDIDDIMVPRLDELVGSDRLVPTLTEEGVKEFPASDLSAWLSENQHERPPGSGPNGEWTLEDEEAAMARHAADFAIAEYEGRELSYGDRPPYDVLADKMRDDFYDFSPEGARARAVDAIEKMSGKTLPEGLGDYLEGLQQMRSDLREKAAVEGLDSLRDMRAEYLDEVRDGEPLPMPDTKAVARKVLPAQEKPPKRPDEFHLEQYDREALEEEQGRKTATRLMREGKEAFDQYEYNRDQEDLKTPGYNKRGVDNPYGGE